MRQKARVLLNCLQDVFGLNGASREGDISLNGIEMTVKETDASGEIGTGTRFTFYQDGRIVLGHYAGGAIERGGLLGSINGNSLIFIYGQRSTLGRIDMGVSHCEIRNTQAGLELTEHFQWLTRSASGKNTLIQMREHL